MAAQPEYYLSTYLEEPTWNALAVMRHDQCMALWERVAGRVHLRRYWELERVTGFKHHRIPLLGEDELRVYVNHLLSEEGLSLDDMTAVWGTPLLSTDSGFTGVVPAGQSVHSVAHLFSALGVNMGNLNASAVLGFAFDAGPDNQLEKSLCPYTYSGCYAPSGGTLKYFQSNRREFSGSELGACLGMRKGLSWPWAARAPSRCPHRRPRGLRS